MVGGAIGGAISAALAMVSLTLIKKTKNLLFKLLIWLGFFAAAVFACWFTAVIISAGLFALV